MKQKAKFGLLGFAAGVLNGLFGAGGGLMVVPLLQSLKLEPKRAHATSIAVILPLSAASAALCLFRGVPVDWSTLWAVLPLGLGGAVAGSFLLLKLPSGLLKRLFGGVMIFSAVRLLLR